MSREQVVMSQLLDVVYEGRWILIVRCTPLPGRKTGLYTVMSKEPCVALGVIRWHGPWHQYSLFPDPETVWEGQCLREVARFLKRQSRAHFPRTRQRCQEVEV